LSYFSAKFLEPAALGLSLEPGADLKRADELASHALTLDPNGAGLHALRAFVRNAQGRNNEAIPEFERALALDPARADAVEGLGVAFLRLGQFEKSLEYFDKAIRLSPHDPSLSYFHMDKAGAYFGLKRYDQAIESARRANAINPNNFPLAHAILIAAFALNGNEAEAQEALQRYLALPPSGLRTIAEWKAYEAQIINEHSDPRIVELWNRRNDGLRKAGMPER
jgi:adenylate cyclase